MKRQRQIPMKSIRWLLAAAMVAISCASMMTQAAPARMAQAAQPAAAPAQDARPAAPVVTTAKVKSLSRPGGLTGAYNLCAVLASGEVLCWGYNGYGQTQIASSVSAVSVPVTMTGVTDAVAAMTGDGRICILHSDTTASCAGNGSYGELGNGTAADSPVLTKVVEYVGGPAMTGIKQLTTGYSYTCVVMLTGQVRCWGTNWAGMLGNGTETDSLTPVTVTGIVSAVEVAITEDSSCALLTSGNVQCWGTSENLGANVTDNMSVPVTVQVSAGGAPLSGIVDLRAGQAQTCGRTAVGEQYCWGDFTYPTRAQRIEDQVNLSGVAQIAPSSSSNCAVMADGTVRCWGLNYNGQIGVGDTVDYSRAVTVTVGAGGVLMDVVELGNAESTYCARTRSSRVYCWGSGENGQIGNGTDINSTRATLVIEPPPAYTNASLSGLAINPGPLDQNFASDRYHYYPVVPNAIASMLVTPTLSDANAAYTITGSPGACTPATSPANCALSVGMNTITVTVTAENGTTKQNYVLHVERLGLPIVTTAKVKSLGRGKYYAGGQVAILTDGHVLFWGEDNFNQLDSRGSQTLPVTLTGVTDAVDVTFGDSKMCIVHADETASCIGNNDGQFGSETTDDSNVLTPVVEYLGGPPMRGIKQMVSSDYHSCAVMTNGMVRCWGDAYNGELGNGTETPSLVPVTVTGITNAVQVALTYDGSCALLASGNVQCWGYAGTPIVGAASNVSVPVTVLTSAGGAPLGGIVELRGGYGSVCGLTAAGEQYCWGGGNQYDYLAGNGTDTGPAFYYPVRAQRIEDQSDLSGVAQVAPADSNSCAVMVDGTVRCWGSNQKGQVGVGDTNAYTRAVTVTLDTGGVLTGVVDMGYGSYHFCALTSVGRVYCWGQGSYWQIGNGVMTNSLRATLVIVPPASTDASLGGLEIHPGTLSPAFAGATYAYTATVPNSVASTVVTPTLSDPKATYTITGSPGACAPATSPANCTLHVDVNLITVTVTAADGVTTQAYTIEIVRAAGVLAIGNVWPKTGVPTGGMPVSLFGSGFTGAYSVTVDGKPVEFEVLDDGRIDITAMPPGTNYSYVDFVVTTGAGSATAEHAYQYIAYSVGSVPATGGVITTASGATITVPALGYNFVLTYTPVTPPIPPLGNVLMHVFRLDAELNWIPVSEISQPITIELPVDPSIVPNGERPWLYVFVPAGAMRTADGRPQTAAVGGTWALVPGQTYNPATMRVTVQLSRMKIYALSTLLLHQFYVPQVGPYYAMDVK